MAADTRVPESTAPGAGSGVPDKPSLDGLEEKWASRWAAEDTYAFDRARYFLPAAARTNLMLVMSARGWVQLCQHLLSHPAPEAQEAGTLIREELQTLKLLPAASRHLWLPATGGSSSRERCTRSTSSRAERGSSVLRRA